MIIHDSAHVSGHLPTASEPVEQSEPLHQIARVVCQVVLLQKRSLPVKSRWHHRVLDAKHQEFHRCGIPGYRARIRPIVSRITIHWPSFYNVVTGKTLALPNLIALQHIPLSPAGVIAKRPAPIALPNSCAAEWRMAPDAVFSPYASVRYFTPHMVHSQYNLL